MVDGVITDADWNALYIDGEWAESESGESTTVEDPLTHETVTHVPRGTEADVNAAYKMAARAQESWVGTPPTWRQEVVRQFLQTLNKYRDEIIDLLAHEVDGSHIMGETSIQVAPDHASETATLPRQMCGKHAASNIPSEENIVQKNPRDMVTVISPWNFPLDLSMRAVAPIVAAGNAVILKPSTSSPITSGPLFVKLFEETDLPKDVVSVVTGRGSEIGDHVASCPKSDVVAFTGSTEVGKRISGIADESLAVPTMELGGNNVHVVTEGADVGHAADAAVFGSLIHQRQVCVSISRRIVHELVYDKYVEKLTERVAELPVDSTHGDDTVVGPTIDESQYDEMLGYIEETVVAGTTLKTGGSTADLDGVNDSLVVQPTVLSGVTDDMTAARNEHFGPIALIIPFSDVDETVELASATEYGLPGSVHAGGLATGREIALQMEAGNVYVNDQPIDDEAHVPFNDAGASGVNTYNSGAFLDEIAEDKWISLQYEPRDYPL